MNTSSLVMSATAQSRADTPKPDLNAALGVLNDNARKFARLAPSRRAELLAECLPRLVRIARPWVEAAVKAKGNSMDDPSASEEWFAGPMATVRNVRLLIESLQDIAREGKPRLPKAPAEAVNGRTEVEVYPTSGLDSALFAGFSAKVRMQEGVSAGEVLARQAGFYGRTEPEGGVSLILGAGNVNSIPAMDSLYKMFTDGNVCLLKMNPVNEYVGPYLEDAFKPMVDAGYFRVVYGGSEVGSELVYHPSVTDVHITGSDRTHDLIVWGPAGEARDRRMAEDKPLLQKSITSELGCVTPVVIVPGEFTPSELQFVAENVATMVVNNGSFNCNAAKMLVTSKAWPQREDLLRRVREVLTAQRLRKAYYPGASERYEKLLSGREGVVKLGSPDKNHLAWALVWGLDSSDTAERLFNTEPFCGILSEATIDEKEPGSFIEKAARFCNDTLWGTLSMSIVIHPKTERDPEVKRALDKAISELRYGAVAINHWAGLVYGTVSPPWGGHPSARLKNIQSGLGWVHNTFMLEGIEKTVLRGPLTVFPKPPFFVTHANAHRVAEKMLDFEASPSWWKVPGIALNALQG